jgi:hypothetical protein
MPNPITDDPEFGKELGSIDFGALIGGPLVAVIDAQAASAMATTTFIQKIGFKGKDDKYTINTVDFSFKKQLPAPGGTGTQLLEQTLTVPLLSMVPVPFIRIDDLLVTFNVKLTSLQKTTSENIFTAEAGASSSTGVLSWLNPVKFKVKSTEKNTQTGSSQIDREYNMNVRVHAVQDAMPAGLAKMLGILEELVTPYNKTVGKYYIISVTWKDGSGNDIAKDPKKKYYMERKQLTEKDAENNVKLEAKNLGADESKSVYVVSVSDDTTGCDPV